MQTMNFIASGKIFLMRHADRVSTAQTGENTTPRSEAAEEDDKPDFDVPHAMTPNSSLYSGEVSQTSSALGRLMEYEIV